MELTIDFMTANASLAQAMDRLSGQMESLEQRVGRLDLSQTEYRQIIVVLDRVDPESAETYSGGDSVCCVSIGLDQDGSFPPKDDELLLGTIATQVRSALAACPLPDPDTELLVNCLDQWRDEYASPKICEP